MRSGADARRQASVKKSPNRSTARRGCARACRPGPAARSHRGRARSRSACRPPPPARAPRRRPAPSAAPIEPPDSRARDVRSFGIGVRQMYFQRVGHGAFVQRPQIQPLAARADGGQKPARRVGEQHQHGARRRLLQQSSAGVGGVVVHVVGGIDDGDAPAARARRHAEEIRPAGGSRPPATPSSACRSFGLIAALQHQQARMRACRHLHRVGIVGRHRQIVRARYRARHRPADSARCDRPGSPCRCRAARRSASPGAACRCGWRARRAPAPHPGPPGAEVSRGCG